MDEADVWRRIRPAGTAHLLPLPGWLRPPGRGLAGVREPRPPHKPTLSGSVALPRGDGSDRAE